MNAIQLVKNLRYLAAAADADNCNPIAGTDLDLVADWIGTGSGYMRGCAERRLRAMRDAANNPLSKAAGAETHIALACEAFEKTYGPL